MSSKSSHHNTDKAPHAHSPEYAGIDLEAMASAENYHRWIIDFFRPYLGRQVAEIGAGCGNFSNLLLNERNIQRIFAFEPSYNMHSLMKDRLGSEARFVSFNSYLSAKADEFQNCFDTVIYNNVMEHVENDERETRLASETLISGGHLLIFVAALPWLYSDFDRSLGHFRRYRKQQGIDLIKQAGLELVSARYVDLPGILPWFLFMKLLRQHLSFSKVSLYDRIAIPVIRVFEDRIPPPVGKNLLIVARKA